MSVIPFREIILCYGACSTQTIMEMSAGDDKPPGLRKHIIIEDEITSTIYNCGWRPLADKYAPPGNKPKYGYWCCPECAPEYAKVNK